PAPRRVANVAQERLWHLLGLEERIDDAGPLGRQRHALEAGGVGGLAEDEAAGLAYLADPAQAVAAGPGEDDRHRAPAEIVRQRAQEVVDRQAEPADVVLFGEVQLAAGDDHLLLGRDEVHLVRLDGDPVGDLTDRELRAAT